MEAISLLGRTLQPLLVNDFGEIEERASDSGDRNVVDNRSILVAYRSLVNGDTKALPPGCRGDIDRAPPESNESPERTSTPMTQQRSVTTGKHRRYPFCSSIDASIAKYVDASMKLVQLTGFDSATNRSDSQTSSHQLPARDHTVLPMRQR